ncbi:DUF424 family protein [Candidatus Woesearchaeota archaeon]|nr:DUF424 family protein [Candidatus Woesearchaeota archaeon]
MYVKIHRKQGSTVVAIADKELIGKRFEEGKFQLEVSEYFYKGEEKSEDEIIVLLQEANNINLVGKKAVALAVKHGMIQEENILRIKKIPHACIFLK